MKCYKMHQDLRMTSTIGGFHPTADAVTVYRGYAVCGEHLEELRGEEPRKWEDFAEIYVREDWPGVNNLGPPTVIE